MAIDAHNAIALNGKGVFLENLGNYTGAIQYFDKALAIDAHFINVLTNKGVALDNLGNHTGAIQYIDKALAINPHNIYTLTKNIQSPFVLVKSRE